MGWVRFADNMGRVLLGLNLFIWAGLFFVGLLKPFHFGLGWVLMGLNHFT